MSSQAPNDPPAVVEEPSDGPILVTGAVRSGTTWVGRVLASARRTMYIHEPFNPDSVWSAAFPVPSQFLYLDSRNGGSFKERFELLLQLEPRFRGVGRAGADDCLKLILEALFAEGASRSEIRPIVKDPIAMLSTEWLVDEFAMIPVIVLRHPISVIKSLLRLDWMRPGTGIVYIKNQPPVIDRFYGGQLGELNAYIDADLGTLERTTLFVRYLYLALADYAETHSNWVYLPYERLTVEASDVFTATFDRLGLEPTSETEALLATQGQYDPAASHQADLRPIPSDPDAILAPTKEVDDWASIMETHFADIQERLGGLVTWPALR